MTLTILSYKAVLPRGEGAEIALLPLLMELLPEFGAFLFAFLFVVVDLPAPPDAKDFNKVIVSFLSKLLCGLGEGFESLFSKDRVSTDISYTYTIKSSRRSIVINYLTFTI